MPLSSSTDLKIKNPINKNKNTTEIPTLWLLNKTVNKPNKIGPINAVALPEKA